MKDGKKFYHRDQGISPQLAARYCRRFGKVSRVLDVGCGTGDPGRYRPGPEVLSAELHRGMRDGASVVVPVPMPKPDIVRNDCTHVRGFTSGVFRRMLEDAHFEIQAIHRMGGFPAREGSGSWMRFPSSSGFRG